MCGRRVKFLALSALAPMPIPVYVTRMRAEDAQIPPNTDKSHAVPIASGNTSQKAAVVLFSGPI